jgi:hypothetical protein
VRKVTTFLASDDLHRLDRVAGVDRALERVGVHTPEMSEITITSSSAATRGMMFLASVVAGAHDVRVSRPQDDDDQLRRRFGQPMPSDWHPSAEHLGDAVEFGGLLGGLAADGPATERVTSPRACPPLSGPWR